MSGPAEEVSVRRLRAICLGLCASTLAVFSSAIANGFVGSDDPSYFSENLHVLEGLSWDGFVWALGTREMGHWHPLTWLSLMADATIWGASAAGTHLSSVLLHVGATACLFLFLSRSTGAPLRSAFATALFALHPLRVEAVAWTSSRKEVLAGFLLTLLLLAHARFARAPSWRRALPVWGLMALGLMAKGTFVAAPLLLLLVDRWPLERQRDGGLRQWWRLGLEKAPLFILGALSAGWSLWSARGAGAMVTLETLPLEERLANAIHGVVFYLEKTVAPFELTAFYPLEADSRGFTAAIAAGMLALVTLSLWWSRRRYPPALVGWLWFLLPLIPVSGLFQAGLQRAADRYTYVPAMGLSILVVWLVPWPQAVRATRVALVGGVALLGVLSVLSIRQLARWENSDTLFSHMLEVTERNAFGEVGLAAVREAQGRYEEAELHAREAVKLQPWHSIAHGNLGRSLLGQGRVVEALPSLRRAVQLDPGTELNQRALAEALTRLGRVDEADRSYGRHLESASAQSRLEWAVFLGAVGEAERALVHLRKVLHSHPELADAWFNAGIALANQGRLDEAERHLVEAAKRAPHVDRYTQTLERVRADLAKSGSKSGPAGVGQPR